MSPKIDLVPTRFRDVYMEYMDYSAESVLRILDIWEDCGIDDSKLDVRMTRVFTWFRERWDDVIEDELLTVQVKRQALQKALDELQEMSTQLEIGLPEKPASLNLPQQLEWVEKTSSKLQKVKDARLAKLEELIAKQKSLQDQMSDLKLFIVGKQLPTEEDLQEFTAHVDMATKERRIRFEKLAPVVDEACRLMESIGKVPSDEVEERLQCLPVGEWDLTCGNIELVARTLQALRTEEQQVVTRYSSLMHSLKNLFDRLEIPEAERRAHLEDLDSKTYQTINRLEELVAEFEELKRANIARFVEKLKDEARSWLLKLRSGEQLDEIDGDPTEEVLTAYEEMITKLKNRFNQLAPLFKLVDERKSLLAMLHELEEAQKDPNRYKNRGGTLLLETKKRERVNKNLPVVVKQIVKFLDQYEADNGEVVIDNCILREEIAVFEEKHSRLNSTTNTPLRTPRMTPATPTTGMRPQSSLRSAFTRSGTYSEMKPKASTLRTPAAKAPSTVGKVYTRQRTMKSPGSTSKVKLSARNALRRSTSYGDFETLLSSNDRQSTRILRPSNGRSSRMTTRKLMF